MPELSPGAEYLVAFLHSAGVATATGMGLTGLSWTEIRAWVDCMDLRKIVTPRDLQVIHSLSRIYANECSKATQKGAVAPYVVKAEMDEEEREVVSDKVEDVFAQMIASQNARG